MRWIVLIFAAYLLLFIGLAVALSNQAAAATCLMWPELQSDLTERYGKAPVFVGRGKPLGDAGPRTDTLFTRNGELT